MVFIPRWISNNLLLITCGLSAFQHARLKWPNPVPSIPLFMMGFLMVMILIIALYKSGTPLSLLVFFLIAISSLGFVIRQRPFMKIFE